jgi:precorrin-2 dehydrogenase/sirohydrochlorin ferrochelatase
MLLPLALDLAHLPVALVGAGVPLTKRLSLFADEASPDLTVFAPAGLDGPADIPADRLIHRMPTDAEIAACRVLFVAGLDMESSQELAAVARRHRVLVNVEDKPTLCDFHVPAVLRRGQLVVSVSTGAASPTLARRLKAYFAALLPPEWAERTATIAAMRRTMRAEGASLSEVARATDALIDEKGWLPPR